jgi:hypothetical protein
MKHLSFLKGLILQIEGAGLGNIALPVFKSASPLILSNDCALASPWLLIISM